MAPLRVLHEDTYVVLVHSVLQQESISVGYVPPVFVVRGGGRVYNPLWILDTPPKEHETRDTYPLERTWDQRYPNPPVDRMTHACENMTFRNFVGGR